MSMGIGDGHARSRSIVTAALQTDETDQRVRAFRRKVVRDRRTELAPGTARTEVALIGGEPVLDDARRAGHREAVDPRSDYPVCAPPDSESRREPGHAATHGVRADNRKRGWDRAPHLVDRRRLRQRSVVAAALEGSFGSGKGTHSWVSETMRSSGVCAMAP